jgi:acyl-coenzyme A thioesterase PaaI-like protein
MSHQSVVALENTALAHAAPAASGPGNAAMRLWQRLSGKPFGKWLFSKLVCFKAPYFASISPRIDELAPGLCTARLKKRRKVHNHIGTVHAIAVCNLAELTAGTMTEATVPPTHRWIPKGMTVEYVKKAATDLKGTASLPSLPIFGNAPFGLPVVVNVTDTSGDIVLKAMITMWITPRKPHQG